MQHLNLPYVNVASSDPQRDIGHFTLNATLRIKVACRHALGSWSSLSVFGTVCDIQNREDARNYIHAEDLAVADLRSLDHRCPATKFSILNGGHPCGYGVPEIIDGILSSSPRRANDLPMFVARGRPTDRTAWSDPAPRRSVFIERTALESERTTSGDAMRA